MATLVLFGRPASGKGTVGQRGDASAVVAAIFQPAESFNEKALSLATADVTDDSTHTCVSL